MLENIILLGTLVRPSNRGLNRRRHYFASHVLVQVLDSVTFQPIIVYLLIDRHF